MKRENRAEECENEALHDDERDGSLSEAGLEIGGWVVTFLKGSFEKSRGIVSPDCSEGRQFWSGARSSAWV
jgi:hypothetical protein